MDPSSGIFTAHEGGVYQISFTGLFHAENGHGVTADVVKKHANGDITHLGRSTADIDENSFICKVFPKTFETPFWNENPIDFIPAGVGTDDSLWASTTVITIVRLDVEDSVYAEMAPESSHGDSKIYSSFNHPGIHFVGHKIAEWKVISLD